MRNWIITIAEPVRQKVAILGAEGLRWLVKLDDLVGELEQEWQVIVESTLEGGSEAYIAQARTRDGSQVILEVAEVWARYDLSDRFSLFMILLKGRGCLAGDGILLAEVFKPIYCFPGRGLRSGSPEIC